MSTASPGRPPAPPRGPNDPAPDRWFPTIMRYAGLAIALYEGFLDRPPQALVVALAALMMAGAKVLERVVERRG